jgi:hypothetical protein
MPAACVSGASTICRRLRRFGLAGAAALAVVALLAPVASGATCAKPYSYAGLVSSKSGYGIRTNLTAASAPNVTWGHVAGWVGVGGVVQGRSAWLQVGYSGFYGGEHKLYYEVMHGERPQYTPIKEIQPGETHRLGVLEMSGRRSWWRVWVDGRAVSPPIYLAGSHGKWQPMATAENWNDGRGFCNGLAYRFSQLRLATRPGGSWRSFPVAYDMQDPGYRVRRTSDGFVARNRA